MVNKTINYSFVLNPHDYHLNFQISMNACGILAIAILTPFAQTNLQDHSHVHVTKVGLEMEQIARVGKN